jgi:hypothetical protein
MSLLKNQQDGSSGDPFTVAGTLVASGQVVSSGTLNVTGAFQLDATAGASGQALVSAGGSNTPTWSTLGTMAAQNSTTVAITGGTITGITDLTVADGGTGASSITANSVILGNGTSTLSGNLVAPSTSGNVLTSNGTTWTSAAPSGLGVGQSWTNVKTSPGRSLGTTYTNSTGKPIQLSVTITHPDGANSEISISVNSVVIGYLADRYGGNTPLLRMGLQHIIPAGATYAISTVVGSPTIESWFELR